MTKTISFAIFFTLLFSAIPAQPFYTLSVHSGTYAHLVSPTPAFGAATYTLQIPFPFTYSLLTHPTATIEMSNDGYINFGSQGIIALDAQLGYLNASSKTSYEVSGASPNRVLKLEWRNHGFSSTPATDDSVSYQVWLYETSNVIEWHFGPVASYPASFGSSGSPRIMLIFDQFNSYAFSGPASSPTLAPCGPGCHVGMPSDGTIYRLTPPGPPNTVGLHDSPPARPGLYPNPAGDMLYSFDEKESYRIVDLLGRERLSLSGALIYEIFCLQPGTYMAQDSKGRISRLVKE